ncbi:MAG TPA: ferritin-like protein [Chloroflexia bacterium]|jgi:hypothetical protein
MADPTTNWTPEALQAHIQDAIDLELWTIPLYLCAMCSIKDQNSEPAQLIMSVAVQEMLHLELACNLANAFGWTPQFNQPVYTPQTGIPFHTPEAPINGPYEVKLGPLDENAINLFLEVELPKDLSADKGQGTLDPAPTYDSIGEFYQALRSGINQLWDTCYQPSSTGMQKTVFTQTNPPQTGNYPNLDIYVDSLADAMQAIDTIVDQGEGADAQGDIPTEFQPTGEPDDALSHYMRFLKVKSELPIDTYTDNGSPATQQQDALNQAFTTLLQNLGTSFSETGTNLDSDAWTAMFSINTLATAVWQAGACPEFRVLSS